MSIMESNNQNQSEILLLSSGEKTEEKEHRTDEEYEAIFNIYSVWKSIPRFNFVNPATKFKMSSEELLETLGIDDPQILELAKIKTQTDFGERYDIHITTLTLWNKRLTNEYDPLTEVKKWAVGLTKNMVFAMYNHAIRKGDAQLYKLWFQVVNDWEEKAQLLQDYKGVTVFNIGPAQNEKKEINKNTNSQARIGGTDRLEADKQTV